MTDHEADSSSTQDGNRQALDELVEQFLQEHRAGRLVSVEDYAARHPELADDMRKVLPALLGLEHLGGSLQDAPSPSPPVEHLGEYRLLREVGRGGMGVVYEAQQESLGRHVALKLLPPQATLDPRYLERFQHEAHVAASLSHPHIVSVFGVGEEQGVHFLAMQFVEGRSLDRVLEEIRRWRQHGEPAPQSISSVGGGGVVDGSDEGYYRSVALIGQQLAEALAHAHARGVLHRDVKPSNVLLDGTGKPWITDFGLAKTDESGDLTLSGEVVGTLRYLAPERLEGISDARGDIYGLGMTLYELLTLRPGFVERDRGKLLRRITQDLPPRPRRVDRKIPQDLESIVLKATEKLPELRYASAAELATDLAAFLDRRPVSARAPSMTHVLRLALGRNKPLAATVGLALVLLVGATIAYVSNLREARDAMQRTLEQMRVQALVAASVEAAGSDATLALLLAREAVRLEQTPEALSQLQKAVSNARERAVVSGPEAFTDVAFSPDGETIAAGSRGVVVLLDRDGRETGRLELQGWVTAVDFAPDGDHLAAATRSGQVTVWDIHDQQTLLLEHQREVRSASYSADGAHLLTASLDGTVRVWLPDGSLLATLEHPAEVLDAAWSRDGQQFVTACADGTARLWSFDAGARSAKPVAELAGHEGQVSAVRFSPRGDRILTISCVSLWKDPAYGDETARLWDRSGRLVAALGGRTGRLQWAGFSPDGSRALGLFTDGRLRVWDAEGQLLHEARNPGGSPTWSAGFSPDGKRVVVGCVDGGTWLFDDQLRVVASLAGHDTDVFVARIAPDGRSIVTASGDGSVRIWDPTVLLEFYGHEAVVYSAAWSPDGAMLVTASEDKTARLWDSEGAPLAVLRGHTAYVRAARFSPDGRQVLTASRDQTARLWDTAGHLLRVYPHPADTIDACFSPDGTEIATTCRGGLVTRWSLEGERLVEFDVGGWATSVEYAADGESLLLAVDKLALLCSLEGETLQRFEGHELRLTSATFSPDGTRVLTASSDTTARLWDARTGEPLTDFRGHQAALRHAAFSSTGERILTSSEDDTARVWRLDGEVVSTLSGLQGLHMALFSPDGRRLLTTSWSGAVNTWLVDPMEILALADRRAHRDFNADEAARYQELLQRPAGEE